MRPAPLRPPACRIAPDDTAHDDAADALYAACFGPGRHAKAASRLREGNVSLRAVSRVALGEDGRLAGACRVWPVRAHSGPGFGFLGPIAVDPAMRSAGLGAALTRACLAAARDRGLPALALVGDRPFFGPLGFTPVPSGRLALPWPADPARLLWAVLDEAAADLIAGAVRSWPDGARA